MKKSQRKRAEVAEHQMAVSKLVFPFGGVGHVVSSDPAAEIVASCGVGCL